MFPGAGDVSLAIVSTQLGGLRWGRNQVSSSVDTTDNLISIRRLVDGRAAYVQTNSFTDQSLQQCVETANRLVTVQDANPMITIGTIGGQSYTAPSISFASTLAIDATARSSHIKPIVAQIASQSLVSAGYLATQAQSVCIINSKGVFAFQDRTSAQYSLTVRTPSGTASGWSGMTQEDWNRLPIHALTETAVQKCLTSANARAIEPGRYDVVLEPQAVAQLLDPIMVSLDRGQAENFPFSPWGGGVRNTTKLGRKVTDSKVTVVSDPLDPDAGFRSFSFEGDPVHRTTWFENGILKNLSYNQDYAIRKLASNIALPYHGSYHMLGGSSSTADLIAATERGLLVTRFNAPGVSGPMFRAYTRDGLWLIERGKITTPVKNLLASELIIDAFNNIQQVGVPIRVHTEPIYSVMVPPLRIRDFNFISLSDAV